MTCLLPAAGFGRLLQIKTTECGGACHQQRANLQARAPLLPAPLLTHSLVLLVLHHSTQRLLRLNPLLQQSHSLLLPVLLLVLLSTLLWSLPAPLLAPLLVLLLPGAQAGLLQRALLPRAPEDHPR